MTLAAPMATLVWDWAQVEPLGWGLLLLFLSLAVGPLVWAWVNRVPISLAIVVSLLVCWLMQTVLQSFDATRDFLILAYAVNPLWQTDPLQVHRLITSAWLHASGSGGSIVFQHILGNALVIGLVGVPLEQRLGRGRFLAIYLIGAAAGSAAWWFSHWGEFRFALGASGAAFGLLGCYLACWPDDEIEFPLVLIRKWPVTLIALVKLGFEIVHVGSLYGGWTDASSVAHLAHIGGFVVCFIVARPIAKNGPTPLGSRDGGPSQGGVQKGLDAGRKSKMGSVMVDPWKGSEHPLSEAAEKALERLRQEGDELETRRAWVEELAELSSCPECGAEIEVKVIDGVARLKCSKKPRHLNWP